MFVWQDHHHGVRRAVTDRFGGVSPMPYAALNLGGAVGDEPHAVQENRTRVAAAFGLASESLVFMDQCHSADVAVVDGAPQDSLPVDAIITAKSGVALAALVADCTPVLLSDAANGVIGAVHSGRPGMVKGVVLQAISAMRDLGAESIEAVVGPSVCARCYEVPPAMVEEAAQVAPESRALSWSGTPAVDVAAGVVAQLRGSGVTQITWVPGCTRENDDLFSYRRDKTTGRFAGVIVRDEQVA